MPLAINSVTGVIREYPANIISHRVLGRNLEVYVEPADGEDEEDKVVIDKKITRRVIGQGQSAGEENKFTQIEES